VAFKEKKASKKKRLLAVCFGECIALWVKPGGPFFFFTEGQSSRLVCRFFFLSPHQEKKKSVGLELAGKKKLDDLFVLEPAKCIF